MAKVAIVTGGTRGIGGAISKALKAAGYNVAANYAGNEQAARHLFRVTASLDSIVFGEAQIQGQVKEAHARALEAGACGAALSRALSAALSAAKRVRTETSIARGAVSFDEANPRRVVISD